MFLSRRPDFQKNDELSVSSLTTCIPIGELNEIFSYNKTISHKLALLITG